jgi:hypothetical protein
VHRSNAFASFKSRTNCSEDWREEEKENENEEEGNAGSYYRSSEQSADITKTAVVLAAVMKSPANRSGRG